MDEHQDPDGQGEVERGAPLRERSLHDGVGAPVHDVPHGVRGQADGDDDGADLGGDPQRGEREPPNSTIAGSGIATRCGFGSAETLRQAFVAHYGTSPSDYQARHRRPGVP